MKDAVHNTGPVVPVERDGSRKKKRIGTCCSICTHHLWFDYVALTEPEGVPEPRHSWTLCHDCHLALVTEMRRSPSLLFRRHAPPPGAHCATGWPRYTLALLYPAEDHRVFGLSVLSRLTYFAKIHIAKLRFLAGRWKWVVSSIFHCR